MHFDGLSQSHPKVWHHILIISLEIAKILRSTDDSSSSKVFGVTWYLNENKWLEFYNASAKFLQIRITLCG